VKKCHTQNSNVLRVLVVTVRDMTVKEWEECKQLSDKAKQKATQNISREYLHRV